MLNERGEAISLSRSESRRPTEGRPCNHSTSQQRRIYRSSGCVRNRIHGARLFLTTVGVPVSPTTSGLRITILWIDVSRRPIEPIARIVHIESDTNFELLTNRELILGVVTIRHDVL